MILTELAVFFTMAELTLMFSTNRMAELKENFEKYAEGNRLKIEDFEKVMKDCGEDVAGYQLRKIIADTQADKGGLISFDEFTKLFSQLSSKASGGAYKKAVDSRKGVEEVGGTSASAAGTRHSVSADEEIGFSDWINSVLEDDPDLKGIIKSVSIVKT